MEQETNLGEQPQMQEGDNVQEGIVDEGTTLKPEADGSLGKFKDAESLLSAYNSLQAEFTKKCQKLSQTQKLLDEAVASDAESNKAEPIFSTDHWNEAVTDFLKQNAKAKEYSGEIATEIMNDKELQNSPNALELAWARVMQKKFESPKTLALDKKFIDEQILSRQEVKEQVLNEYFKNLQNVKTPPVIAKSGTVAFVAPKEPKSMAEAKDMVEKLFNLKG